MHKRLKHKGKCDMYYTGIHRKEKPRDCFNLELCIVEH